MTVITNNLNVLCQFCLVFWISQDIGTTICICIFGFAEREMYHVYIINLKNFPVQSSQHVLCSFPFYRYFCANILSMIVSCKGIISICTCIIIFFNHNSSQGRLWSVHLYYYLVKGVILGVEKYFCWIILILNMDYNYKRWYWLGCFSFTWRLSISP